MEQAFTRSKNIEVASKSMKTAKLFNLKNFPTYGIMCVCVCAHMCVHFGKPFEIITSVNWLCPAALFYNISTIGWYMQAHMYK